MNDVGAVSKSRIAPCLVKPYQNGALRCQEVIDPVGSSKIDSERRSDGGGRARRSRSTARATGPLPAQDNSNYVGVMT